jgi:hypothetical protein
MRPLVAWARALRETGRMKSAIEWAEDLRSCMQVNTIWCELDMRCAADHVERVRAELLRELTDLLHTIAEGMNARTSQTTKG